MRTLDQLPEGERVVIPAIYNSGRKATVRCTLGAPWAIHISIDDDPRRPYDRCEDGYLHVRTESIDKDLAVDPTAPYIGYRFTEAEKIAQMIQEVNIHYFAKTLTVLSDSKEIADRVIPRKRTWLQMFKEIRTAWNIDNEIWFADLLHGRKSSFAKRLAMRLRNIWTACQRQTERIEVVQPLSEAHLGGSWQHYYAEGREWTKKAEQLSAHPVYLA